MNKKNLSRSDNEEHFALPQTIYVYMNVYIYNNKQTLNWNNSFVQLTKIEYMCVRSRSESVYENVWEK